MPPPPKKSGSGEGRGGCYTAAAAALIGMGVSWAEVRSMPFSVAMALLRAWEEANTPEKDRVRRATRDDVRSILMG